MSSLASDIAGETIDGQSVNYEPTGPNTPLAFDANGNELYPGPGDNSYIDRPNTCLAQPAAYNLPSTTCLLGGGSYSPGARTDNGVNVQAGSSTIGDNSIVATDGPVGTAVAGRSVTGTGIPAGSYVGAVNDSFVNATAANGSGQPGAIADTGSFTLVNSSGTPVNATAYTNTITLGAVSNSKDPLFTSTGVTNGGGDTGSVLISPYISPGSQSDVFYNHYSWLRTMEDLFGVAAASPGIDGLGHIGYAAQVGLQPFGTDVFNNVPSSTVTCQTGFKVVNGTCVKIPTKPKTPTCKKGTKLSKGKCVKIKPKTPVCKKGTKLSKGKCVKVKKSK